MSPLLPDEMLMAAGLLTPESKVADGLASAAPPVPKPMPDEHGFIFGGLPPEMVQMAKLGRVVVGGQVARMAMFPDEFPESKADKPNVVMRGVRGIAAGIADMAPSTMALAASVIDFMGADEAGAALGQKALDVSSWLNDHLAVENPNLYDHAMRGVGSMLTFILPGIGAASAAGKIAKAAGMAGKAAEAFRALTGGTAMSFLEAAVEQSQREMELIGKGMTPEQAMKESAPVFWHNMGVLTATNTVGYFLPLPIKTKNEFIRRAAKAIEAAFTEGGQERAQAVIQDVASGAGEWGDFLNPQKYGVEAAVGAIVGGGTAALLPGEPDAPQNAPSAPVANAPAQTPQSAPAAPAPQQAPAQAAQSASQPIPPAAPAAPPPAPAPAAPRPEPGPPPAPPANLPMEPAAGFDVYTEPEAPTLARTPAQREAEQVRPLDDGPPSNEADYISAREYRKLMAGTYVNGEGEVIASSRRIPQTAEQPPVGTWKIDDLNGIYGREIEQLRDVAIDDLVATEFDREGRVEPTKRADVETYANWMSEGREAPPIQVLEREDGSLAVTDGHRRLLAAKKAGATTIRAWVSPIVETGKTDSNGKPIKTGLTYEIANGKPVEAASAPVANAPAQTPQSAPAAPAPQQAPAQAAPATSQPLPPAAPAASPPGQSPAAPRPEPSPPPANLPMEPAEDFDVWTGEDDFSDVDEEDARGPVPPPPAEEQPLQPPPAEREKPEWARNPEPEAPLSTFENLEDGVRAEVRRRKDGRYAVSVQDIDSGERFEDPRIFPAQELAEGYARKVTEPKPRRTQMETPTELPPLDQAAIEAAGSRGAEARRTARETRGQRRAREQAELDALNAEAQRRMEEAKPEPVPAPDKNAVVNEEYADPAAASDVDELERQVERNRKLLEEAEAKIAAAGTNVPPSLRERRDDLLKSRKQFGFQLAAARRRLTGDLTAIERKEIDKRRASNHVGKPVSIRRPDGTAVNGKIVGTPFGRVSVELETGEKITVDKENIGSPIKNTTPVTEEKQEAPAAAAETKQGTLFRASKESLGSLNRAASGRGLSEAVPARPPVVHGKMAVAAAKMFGFKNVQFVSGLTTKDGRMAHGYYQPESDTVFLNIGSTEPMLTVLMHEVAHRMEASHPDLYGQLIQILNDPANVRRGGKEVYAKDAKARGYAEVGVESEWVADGLMEASARPEFWNVLQEKNPTLAGKLVQMIVDAMKAIRKMFVASGASVDVYYNNFGPMVRQIANVAAQMQAREAAAITRETTSQIEMFRVAPIGNPLANEMRDRQDAAMKANNQHRHQGWSAGWRHVYMMMVDKHTFTYAMIRDIVKAANPKLAENFSLVMNPYIALRRFGSWMSAVEVALKHGVYSWDGKTVLAPGLEQVIRKHGLADAIDSREFGMFYTAATLVSRKYSLASRGFDFFGNDPTSDEYQAAEDEFLKWQKIYDDYKAAHPEWESAVDDFTKYAYALIRRSYEAGVISEDEFNDLTKTYSVYAPLFVIDSSRYNVDRGDPVGAGTAAHEMKRFDPTAVRMDPIDALIKQTYHLEFFTRRNEAARKHADFIRMFRDKSMKGVTVLPGFGMRVKPKTDPVAKRVKELLEAAGMSEAEITALGRTPEQLEREAKLYVTSRIQPDGVIALLRNGNVEYWQLEPDIYESFMAATGPKASHPLMRFFSAQTSLLRAGAVLTPDFMARNQFRDFASSAIISQHLIRNPVDPFLVPVRILRGLSHAIKQDDVYLEFMLEAGHAQLTAQDQKSLRKSSEAMTRDARGRLGRAGQAVRSPVKYVLHSHPITILQEFGKLTENSTRIAIYEKTKADLLKMGKSEAEARAKAAMEARESSIDFARSGTYGQVINQIIPFFNAAVQGNDKAWRTFVRDSGGRGSAWLKATALITVPSVLLWALNYDEDWYKEQPIWLKNNFWLFSVDGGKTIHKLPKPFEVGLMYASLAERFLDWRVGKDPKAMKEWSEAILKNVVAVNDKNPVASVGGLLGPMAGTMTEIVSNYDSFRGTPIVKGWLEEVAPREQFNANTSEFAKALGGMAPGSGLSPMMIDHFIRGTFGGLGVYAAQAASEVIMAARPELKAMKPSDKQVRLLVGAEVPDWIPVIRAFASASPSGYTRQMNDFFEIYDRGREASKTLQAFKASGAPREKFISLYRRSGADIATFKASQEVAEKLGQLSKRARFIESMPGEQMSRDEKRRQIDQLTETRNLLVGKFLERYYQIDQREIQRQIEASIPQLERAYGR